MGTPKFLKVDAEKDIGSLEKMLRKSPITIVMVYMGWCGHCQKAKPNFMDVAKKNHPGVSFALLNGDLQEKTSLKSVKIEGVPEVVVVVPDSPGGRDPISPSGPTFFLYSGKVDGT